MAKDPAFNFYTNDFDSKTKFFNHEQVGMYLRLLMAQHQHGHLSESQMMYICGRYDKDVFSKFIQDENGLFFNERLEMEIIKRRTYVESRRQSRLKSDEDNVHLYIVRDNARDLFKIGSSVNPLRRYNELSNQASPALMGDNQGERDLTLVWYSNPVLRIKERELHKKFSNKKSFGEWFSLSKEDLNWIIKTYDGTYVDTKDKRTLQRTENENENEKEKDIDLGYLKEVDPKILKQASELTESICEYFDVKTIVTSTLYNSVCDFISTIANRNELNSLSDSFQKYKSYKTKSQETRHNINSWIGKKENHYQDGQWIMINWETKYKRLEHEQQITKGASTAASTVINGGKTFGTFRKH